MIEAAGVTAITSGVIGRNALAVIPSDELPPVVIGAIIVRTSGTSRFLGQVSPRSEAARRTMRWGKERESRRHDSNVMANDSLTLVGFRCFIR